MKCKQTLTEMHREISAAQTHCYTCGGRLGHVRYECPTCQEMQCSEKCRANHIETLDNI